ncbi:acyltransferase [Hymenobacter sp. YC55]|uniref:acyltransferase family protein n=1 Tax=Hymenobacter sp. YC55 TaxID=3034019 RepID=UPI0023F75180|nr:acyltransferase [Hymenobacter sp. YC55]MDF7810654.1 acyltransferase [Hymenobacter sp. YC55]
MIEQTTTKAKAYFPALTGIRAIAAYLVFFYHFGPARLPWPCIAKDSGLAAYIEEWHVGVTLFFVLSGFLIATRYQDSVQLTGKWAFRYFRNRFARIYPLYFLVTLLAFVSFQLNPTWDGTEQWPNYVHYDKPMVVVLNLTFLRGFFEKFIFTGLAQGWTLTVEECFYALAPLLLLTLKRRWQLLFGHAAALPLLGFLLVYVSNATGLATRYYEFMGSYQFMLNFTFFGRCIEFFVGMGLALYLKRYPQQVAKGWKITAVSVLWMAGCIYILSMVETPLDLFKGTMDYRGIAVNNLLLPLGVVGLLYGLIYEQNWFQALLQTQPAQALGKSSYAFYLVHMSTFQVVLREYVTESVAIQFILLVALSWVLFHFIEEPIQKRLTGSKSVAARKAAVDCEPVTRY